MIFVKSILFIAILVVVSIVFGKAITIKCKSESISIAYCYVIGMLGMFSIFHPMAVIFTYLDASLSALTIVYLILLVIVVCYLYQGNNQKMVLFNVRRKMFPKDILFFIVLCLIVFQVLYVCVFAHMDGDDATYVGIATTAWSTDTLNHFNPTTGVELDMVEMTDYKLAPFSVFWAMWAKVFELHPAFLMHSLCPVLLIPMAYVVYYLIGQVFFKEREKVNEFLWFVCLLNLWGNWSVRSNASFLLLRIWQGKAVLAAILIPLTIFFVAQVRKENVKCGDWVLLFLNSVSCCFVSGMGAILFPVLLIAYALSDVLGTKRWLQMKYYIVCLIPCVVSAVLYIVLKF